jgi:hypothetical protein
LDLRKADPVSVHILLEPALFLEFSEKGDRLIGRPRAELGHNIDQRALDILGHALGVTANVNVGTSSKPRPQFASDLTHAILH